MTSFTDLPLHRRGGENFDKYSHSKTSISKISEGIM